MPRRGLRDQRHLRGERHRGHHVSCRVYDRQRRGRCTRNGTCWSGEWCNIRMGERPYFQICKLLRLKDALLFIDDRLYLPATMRKDAFSVAHEIHADYKATYQAAETDSVASIFWDVRDWMHFYSFCSTKRLRLSQKFETFWSKGLPYQRIHKDWWSPVRGEGNHLLLVDADSGWIEATLLKERTTDKVIMCLSVLCSCFGVPIVGADVLQLCAYYFVSFYYLNASHFFTVFTSKTTCKNELRDI